MSVLIDYLASQVLVVRKYWKNAFLITDRERAFGIKHMSYSQAMLEKANHFQSELGLKEGFSAVQWRAETAHGKRHYEECAEYLASNFPNGTLLISDLPYDPEKPLWSWKPNNATATPQQKALKYLFAHGFRKIDQLAEVRNISEIGIISMLDVIFAVKADKFYTCLQATPICWCNRKVSNFARLMINERQMQHKVSALSWTNATKFDESENELRGCTQGTELNVSISVCQHYDEEDERDEGATALAVNPKSKS
eukprot:gnl/TRDRNA2_/TRDRNA2_82673_c0_seq2.p1 gnl/TRDRNA2_/TRDRNA2_82673_c0~~gnl/TRDRNA2_/TRDRNA2_82673_c0_seq2.p1  ORF type:complete len:254 (+),score=31.40 gnl/TRDRNA2_/TRDRNA2_82673_c0_seq2:2-763(+)